MVVFSLSFGSVIGEKPFRSAATLSIEVPCFLSENKTNEGTIFLRKNSCTMFTYTKGEICFNVRKTRDLAQWQSVDFKT